MAIQVNGTEVISNSRALNNIASVDATTVAAFGAAGVGGLTATETTSALAFSYTGTTTFGYEDIGIISTSQPTSNIVYASKTISSGVSLASIHSVTAASGFTPYIAIYYGATIGLMHWDGTYLRMLARGHHESDLSGGSSTLYIRNKIADSGLIAVSPGDVLYGCVISSYSDPSYTGGAAWPAGNVTTTFLEVS